MLRHHAGHAVAAVDYDRWLLLELNTLGDLIDVGGHVIASFQPAIAVDPILGFNAAQQVLNLVASQRDASDHHLKAVVVFGVVTARDHDAGLGFADAAGVIHQGRGYDADINNVKPGALDTLVQRLF